MTKLDEVLATEGIQVVYRIKNSGTWGKYSKRHKVYLYGRRYELIGDITVHMAMNILADVFLKSPERRLTTIQPTPDGRTLYVYWQQDNPMA